jgi:pimeloyl-ACP methyl ester carboxylesterase
MSHRSRNLLGDRGTTAAGAMLVVAALCALAAPAHAEGIADVIDRLDPHPCYAGTLTCVTIPAPLDHESPGDNRRLDIEFAVHAATGDYRGTLIYFVGGPGQAGVPFGSVAMDWFDPAIPEHYDIVFFDQRGTGPRHGVECVDASLEYWLTHWDFEKLDSVVASVQDFVADCIAESGRAEILPYLSTEQAARDVELFRQAIGAPKVWLYGASYGTYIAQVYAAIFPEAIEAVILDAVMDPAVDLATDSAYGADAAEQLFERMAASCREDEYCRSSFETDPLAVYDTIMAQLEKAPMAIMFPLSDGRLERRELTPEMLFGGLSMALYTPYDRTSFLNALAAAELGDFVPLARMGYRSFELDPDTLLPYSAEGGAFDVYWGAFYGISCADYAVPGADPVADAHAAFEAGLARRDTHPRFFGYLIGLQPECRFWPAIGDGGRPPLFTGGDYRTLILAADADAATPIANAQAVYERLADASMVSVRGGPHVVYGWGETCIDDVVTRWLVDGDVPEPGVRYCDQTVLDPFRVVDNPGRYEPGDAHGVAWGVIAAVESAAMTSGWQEDGSVRLGCSHGGTMTLRPLSGDGYARRYRLEGCSIWPDVAVTGLAIYRDTDDEWGWDMTLELAGAHEGNLIVDFDFRNGDEIVEGVLDDAETETAAHARAEVAGGAVGAKPSTPAKPSSAARDLVEPPEKTRIGANR